ncbi:hypothetical protein ANCCAN_13437 [Ancylostoma caninum]|uniref:Uncharacterized protein n=1 Tax=Ancylostoma caninum TaxID=29170 RepID=A0A368GA90_ANCCA|nr:hypothetical protein ANCCAN_13437 [Ancylostoma caninum]
MLLLVIALWVTGASAKHHFFMDAPARVLDPFPVEPPTTEPSTDAPARLLGPSLVETTTTDSFVDAPATVLDSFSVEPPTTDSFVDAPARVLDSFSVEPPTTDSFVDAPARVLDSFSVEPPTTDSFVDAPARILDAFPVEPPATEVNDPDTACKEPKMNTTETSSAEMVTVSFEKAKSAVASFFREFAENIESTMQLLYRKLREFCGFEGRSELPTSKTLHGNANIQVDKALVKTERCGGDEVAIQPAENHEEHQGGGDVMVASARNEELQYQRHPMRFLHKVEQLKAEFQNDPSYRDETNK